CFELLKSDGSAITCSPTNNAALFNATIAGLGLTGFITWAEIQLRKINNPLIDMESIKFSDLDEFFELSASSDKDFEYTVSWLDCLSSGRSFGRGIFMRGNHSKSSNQSYDSAKIGPKLSIPFDLPGFVLNRASIKVCNWAYYNHLLRKI